MVKKYILFLFFIFAGVLYASGPYYVDDNTGNDGNPGTYSQPFATLQYAVNMMMPGVTSATTYVFPGNYAQNIVIRSNKNNGYMVITALSNDKPPHFTGGLWAFAFVTNTSRVIFKNLYISNYSSVGIYLNSSRSNISLSNTIVHIAGGGWGGGVGLFNSSDYNRIIGNILHNNDRSIKIDGSLTRFNMISNNNVSYDTSDAGIYLRAECCSNYIFNNLVHGESQWGGGIYLESAHQNVMKKNTIWSNNLGIYFDNNSQGNTICSNKIFTNNQAGIYLKNSTNTLVLGNTIYAEHGTSGAIFLDFPAYNNKIIGNTITNSRYGIYCYGDNNHISQNYLYKNSDNAITFDAVTNCYVISNALSENKLGIQTKNNCSSITLFRNGIYKSQNEGLYISFVTNMAIINNTIISNHSSANWGAQIQVPGHVDVFKNNIVALYNVGYGIYSSGTILSLTYNDVFSNTGGNYAGCTPGAGTITNNPLLLSTDIHNSNFLALSSSSPCIDAGDPSDPVPPNGGSRIDMGWKETEVFIGPYYVHSTLGNDSNPGTFFQPFATVSKALSVMDNTTINTCYIAGTFTSSLDINKPLIDSAHTIVLTAWSNNTNPWLLNNPPTYGIRFDGSVMSNIIIKHLKINASGDGIQFWYNSTTGTRNIIFISNRIWRTTAGGNGFYFDMQCKNIQIKDTIISNFQDGAYFYDITTNISFSNCQFKNESQNGIYDYNLSPYYLKVLNCRFENNGNTGIYFSDRPYYTTIRDSYLIGGQYGVHTLRQAYGHFIFVNNKLKDCTTEGIHIGDTIENFVFQSNVLVNTGNYGLYTSVQNCSFSNEVKNNLIVGNTTSCFYMADRFFSFTMRNNTLKGVGTTYIARLYTSGTINFRNNILVGPSTTGVSTIDTITYSYNDVTNTSTPYSPATPGTGAITNSPLFISTNSADWTNANYYALSSGSPCIDAGDPADPVPSNGGTRIDMGWKEFDSGGVSVVTLSLHKSISNIISPFGAKPVPGGKIVYKLYYTNIGTAENQCIYDHLPSNTTFWTGYYASSVTGWTLQYSTNSSPINQFNSSDYTSIILSDKTTIKWIRWKKSALNNNEFGVIYYEVLIK